MKVDDTYLLAGRVIIAGFEGVSLPKDLAKSCEQGSIGGVVLFRRNVESGDQVHGLLDEIKSRAPIGQKPITSIDQEGGRVVRIKEPCTHLPSARVFGGMGKPEITQLAGRLVGAELRALGFTLNFAPVLDVDTNPDSPVIGDRSYGPSVSKVITHGFAFARGLSEGGVIPCAKHFPGHGDATVDSHLSLPTVTHNRERLRKVELEPFAAWSRSGLGSIMTAHIVFPALDNDNPATTSRAVLTDELRNRFAFKGAIFTDDLEMGAIGQLGGAAKMAVAAIKAGADGLLICKSAKLREEVQNILAREASRDLAFCRRLEKAARRLAPLAHPLGPSIDYSWLGSAEHKEVQNKVNNAF